MKINRRVLFVILLLVGITSVLWVSTYLYVNGSRKMNEDIKISVIVYGSYGDRWAALRQGIDQGASDLSYQVNFVTMVSDNDYEEQVELIEREISNGADGLIIAASDSKKMSEIIRDTAVNVPVVMVETNISDGKGLTYLSADNYSMGLNIGRSVILNNEKTHKIALLMENHQRESVLDRYDGFMDSLQYSDFEIDFWERDEQDEDVGLFIEEKLKSSKSDIIVALDTETLEAVVESMSTYGFNADVYGIGSTNTIIHYLDYGLIKAIVYQNEFNMGYISVRKLLDNDKKSGGFETEVDFRTINRETMYLPKNQRLVFPIIQ
ncbi:MAG: sugar ABC transporter substrate-binding protein [Clostridiales bacterium]|nr:sugar ABC transporter substrate-binding protein [Clostridiales bacterium]